MVRLALGLLLVCGSAAAAPQPPDRGTALKKLQQAFLTGAPAPDVAGPGREFADRLRTLVLTVQAGTNGSAEEKRVLSREIDDLAALMGRPPRSVIEGYLSRVKAAGQGPRSGTTSAPTAPPAPRWDHGSVDAAITRSLAHAKLGASIWQHARPIQEDDLVFARISALMAARRAAGLPDVQLPKNLKLCAPEPPPAVLRDPYGQWPTWNPGGKLSFIDAASTYWRHMPLSLGVLNPAYDHARLNEEELESDRACARGTWTASCLRNKTDVVSGSIVTAVQDHVAQIFSPQPAERTRAILNLTPLGAISTANETVESYEKFYQAPSWKAASVIGMTTLNFGLSLLGPEGNVAEKEVAGGLKKAVASEVESGVESEATRAAGGEETAVRQVGQDVEKPEAARFQKILYEQSGEKGQHVIKSSEIHAAIEARDEDEEEAAEPPLPQPQRPALFHAVAATN